MGKALERALSKVQNDLPLSPAVLRGQLRRIAVQDLAVGASGSGDYVFDAADTRCAAIAAAPGRAASAPVSSVRFLASESS